MARYQLPDGQVAQAGSSFEYAGNLYPPNWFQFSTPDERAAIGAVELVEHSYPSTDLADVTGNPDGSYTTTPWVGERLTNALIAYAMDRRWQKETGGIEVAGVPVATDDRSQLKILGSRVAAAADPNWTADWAVGDQTFVITAGQMIAISDAVAAHVGAVFTTFKGVVAGIKSGEITTKAQVDDAYTS